MFKDSSFHRHLAEPHDVSRAAGWHAAAGIPTAITKERASVIHTPHKCLNSTRVHMITRAPPCSFEVSTFWVTMTT